MDSISIENQTLTDYRARQCPYYNPNSHRNVLSLKLVDFELYFQSKYHDLDNKYCVIYFYFDRKRFKCDIEQESCCIEYKIG